MKSTPTDRGYAWVVLAASVGCNYLSGFLVYFVGVIQVELLHKYQDDVTTTAWASSVYSSLQTLGAPLASWVVHRFNCRMSVVMGGVFQCVGFTLSAFTTSVLQLIFTYGLVAGTGLGLTYSPSLMIITFYFDKFRGLASGFSVAGCGIGILTGPLFTQYLIDNYSLSGAFLIIAGLGLNSAVFGMLYRPTQHEGTGAKRGGRSSQDSKIMLENNDENTDEESSKMQLVEENAQGLFDITMLVNAAENTYSSSKSLNEVVDGHEESNADLHHEIDSSEQDIGNDNACDLQVQTLDSIANNKDDTEERTGLINSLDKHTIEESSNKTDHVPNQELGKESAKKNSVTKLQALRDKFSGILYLIQNRAFLMHCASVFFAGFNMAGVFLHLPEYSIIRGSRTTQAAALFVAVGIFSVASRIGFGFLLTSRHVNGLVLNVSMMALCGAASSLFPLYSATYVGQMVFASLFGLSTGGFYTLINVLTVELVGFRSLDAAYGVLIFSFGIGYVVGPPLSGLAVDYRGTYEHSFIILGLAMFASAAFDLLAKVIHTRKRKKNPDSGMRRGSKDIISGSSA